MEIYLVGGAVRDELLGRPTSDRDWVVVDGSVQEMRDAGYKQVGRDFPVFLHPHTHEEYALARIERKTGAGHQGFVCHTGPDVSLEDDLLRRDLTINAMARDDHGNLIDPYGGARDLAARCLRHVSGAFVEDPLRVFRVARFAAELKGFQPVAATMDLMGQMARQGTLDELPGERVWVETAKALKGGDPERFFDVLHSAGAMKPWFEPLTPHVGGEHLIPDQLVQPLARFGALGWKLSPHQAEDLCARLKPPSAYVRLLKDIAAHGSKLANWREQTEPALYPSIAQCGGLRASDHWQQVMQVIPAVSGTVLDELVGVVRGMSEVRGRDFAALGLTGAQIGQRLEHSRRALLRAAL